MWGQSSRNWRDVKTKHKQHQISDQISGTYPASLQDMQIVAVDAGSSPIENMSAVVSVDAGPSPIEQTQIQGHEQARQAVVFQGADATLQDMPILDAGPSQAMPILDAGPSQADLFGLCLYCVLACLSKIQI